MVDIQRRWNGTTSDASVITNWDHVSLVNSLYQWTASGSGTDEYYLEAAGGGDPDVPAEPDEVWEVSQTNEMEVGTAGSLAAGEWDWADNDTLGYSTIYVRLTSGNDPDSETTGYVTMLDTPQAGDYVRIPAGTGAMISNIDFSATQLASFVVEDGYKSAIGSAGTYLKLNLANDGLFQFFGEGQAYIDLGATATSPEIHKTRNQSAGQDGLHLIGTGMGSKVLWVYGGNVGLASRHGELSTVGTIRQLAGELTIGKLCTLTTLEVNGGTCYQRCSATTTTIYAGAHEAQEAAAQTTLNVNGGSSVHNSSGTVGTGNLNGGVLNVRRGTITTLNHARDTATLQFSQAATITTYNEPSGPVEIKTRAL